MKRLLSVILLVLSGCDEPSPPSTKFMDTMSDYQKAVTSLNNTITEVTNVDTGTGIKGNRNTGTNNSCTDKPLATRANN